MKKILFLALFAFMLTGCRSSNGPLDTEGKGRFLLMLANSSHVIIDESDIEMYEIMQMYEGIPDIFAHWIRLNDVGSERLRSYATWNEDFTPPIAKSISIIGKEFSIIFGGKKLYKGIFVCAPSKMYESYTVDLVFVVKHLPCTLVLETVPNNTSLVERKDEDELFEYFDSIGKLKRIE
jgi:hypothetical protein